MQGDTVSLASGGHWLSIRDRESGLSDRKSQCLCLCLLVWQILVWVPRFQRTRFTTFSSFVAIAASLFIADSLFYGSHCLKLTVSLRVENSADCVAEFEFLLTVSQNACRSTSPILNAAPLAQSSPLWPDVRFPKDHTRIISSLLDRLELTVSLQATNSADCVAESEILLTMSQNAYRSNGPVPNCFHCRHCRLPVHARIILSLPEFLELTGRCFFSHLSQSYN